MSTNHRKRIRHYHEPGDFHELTFSCYQQRPLLTNDCYRRWLAASIDAACRASAFHLNAFVFMPEHVHLLVWPTRTNAKAEDISQFLAVLKRPVSRQVKAALAKSGSSLLAQLTIRNRPNSQTFRFWQEGPGYDRNLQSEKAVTSSLAYIHDNPVRRKLVKQADGWKWSSIHWYLSEGQQVDPDLPRLNFPPGDLYSPIV